MSDKTQPETEFLLNGVPYDADARCSRKPGSRVRWKRRLLIGVLMIETCFALPEACSRAISQRLRLDLQLHPERHRQFT